MSHFLNALILEPEDDGVNWVVKEDFDYDIGEIGGEKIIVPAGFRSDLGSVPQIFWNLIPPIGKPLRGYILHDWLYSCQTFSRFMSDNILLEAMEVAGVGYFKRITIYFAVRLFGWVAWKKNNGVVAK